MHQDYYGFLEFLRVNPQDSPVVIIEGEKLKKFVFHKQINETTKTSIKEFLGDYFAGKIIG